MTLKSEDLSGISADEVAGTANDDVSRDEVEASVRKLIQWAGDDPDREGLLDTPKRVVKAFEEFFSGYAIDPTEYLERTFEETDGYDEMILLRDISFISHCEHHILPVIGKAHVAYLPDRRVVGISKLARVVEAFAKRLLEGFQSGRRLADLVRLLEQEQVVDGALDHNSIRYLRTVCDKAHASHQIITRIHVILYDDAHL